MRVAEPTKACNGPLCEGQRKLWSEFYRDSKTGGPRTYCKECEKGKARDWQQANRDRVHAHQRTTRARRRSDPELHAAHLSYQREWRRRKDRIPPERYRTERLRQHTTSTVLPAEPFAAWLREVIARDGVSITATGLRLGLADAIRPFIDGRRRGVDLNTVERALLADDTITLRELYPSLYLEAA